ncbi:type IV toxin-antitoxin system AbiEi family antitoxin [Variovorax sp. LT1R16]|uniref:type IV toxin-antitoxin system AbiEi family antitoxin n=1 Tax=Variovorax sp. LT1R16 TaxID=3443728 RepID=UPI003F4644B1
MKRLELIGRLAELDRRGIYVLARRDLDKLFPAESAKSMEQSLKRMVDDRLLERAARGLYVNPAASSRNRWIAEEIAKALRPDALSYVSLESMLSEYGVISQIPIDRMTVMTTGGSGLIETPYGTIEFTHTKRGVAQVIKNTLAVKGRPLRIATQRAAVRDLLRVGRNANMLDRSHLEEGEDE